MYQSDDSYEPYPTDINVMIEKAYREKKQSVSWEENHGRFEVDFVRMVEEKDGGGAGSIVKVKRNSTGMCSHATDWLRYGPTRHWLDEVCTHMPLIG